MSVRAGDVIIVYSQATGRVRRWFASNVDDEIRTVRLVSGEGSIQVSKDTVKASARDANAIQAFVTAATGRAPSGDRYCVVRTGAVLTAILADPACGDDIPGCQLIQHDTADARWTYNSSTGVFRPPTPTQADIDNAANAALRAR